MDQAVKPVPAQNVQYWFFFDRRTRASGGRLFLRRPVRPMRIVVIGVLAEDQPQVPFASDQHPVQALAAGVPTQRSAMALDRIVNYVLSG